MGSPFEERGARTEETIAVMRVFWTEDEPRFDGVSPVAATALPLKATSHHPAMDRAGSTSVPPPTSRSQAAAVTARARRRR
jgi:alkanesulfonate monooxygenase SsuD/methylene tetrahydromethanopterin reductase-like flavin-dependent oxidoreductase (luciferase family)